MPYNIHGYLPQSAVEYLSIPFAISVTNHESSHVSISCRQSNFCLKFNDDHSNFTPEIILRIDVYRRFHQMIEMNGPDGLCPPFKKYDPLYPSKHSPPEEIERHKKKNRHKGQYQAKFNDCYGFQFADLNCQDQGGRLVGK